MLKRALLLPALLFLAACSVQPTLPSAYLQGDSMVRECAEFYAGLDRLVSRYGVQDIQGAAVAGFPYLRTNRFLASFRNEITDSAQLQFWIENLQHLDQEARRLEIANLPADDGELKASGLVGRERLSGRLHECGEILLKLDLDKPKRVQQLRKQSRVADNYRGAARVFGFYPLSSLFVGIGARRLQREIIGSFKVPLQERQSKGALQRYLPQAAAEPISHPDISALIQQSSTNSLHVPLLTKHQLERLFMQFAPAWEIDVVDDNDKIGKPYWDNAGQVRIDTGLPVVYHLPSYTRLNGEILLQLNYIIWFPARPLTGTFDLLGGHLDGITWRVTLSSGGEPLMYDAMHNCGCYHMFFPAPGVVKRPGSDNLEEPILVPIAAPAVNMDQRLLIRVTSGSHYIENIRPLDTGTSNNEHYRLVDYTKLRSLPSPHGGNRSMFGTNGIVAGTSRKERWLLWPMGIADPGAMRQWGTHATAFIGRRHFDDPFLLQNYFQFQGRGH